MSIDEKIRNIDSLRFAMKIEINSTYGVNFDGKRVKKLYDKSYELRMQKKYLLLQKERFEKLNKINLHVNDI